MSREVRRSPALIAAELWDAGGAEEAAVLPHAQRSGAKHVGLQSLLIEAVRWQSRIAYRQEHTWRIDTQNLREARMREVARAIWEWRLGVGSSSRTKHGFTLMGRGSRILRGQVAEKVNGYTKDQGRQRQRHLRYIDSQNASKWQLIDGCRSALSCVGRIN